MHGRKRIPTSRRAPAEKTREKAGGGGRDPEKLGKCQLRLRTMTGIPRVPQSIYPAKHTCGILGEKKKKKSRCEIGNFLKTQNFKLVDSYSPCSFFSTYFPQHLGTRFSWYTSPIEFSKVAPKRFLFGAGVSGKRKMASIPCILISK